MARIDEATIEHTALLARLTVTEEEKEELVEKLNRILTHIDKMNELDTSDVEPTSHSLPVIRNVSRQDKGHQELGTEGALANAPDSKGPYFKVPRVVE